MAAGAPVSGAGQSRGNHQSGSAKGLGCGSIHVWAGKPISAISASRASKVYPRVGGGTPEPVGLTGFCTGLSPHKRAVGTIFSIRISLPKSFRPNRNPPTRPASYPTLLKTTRRKIQKPSNPKPQPVQNDDQPNRTPNPAKALRTRPKQTPEQRKAYDRARNQTPERKEFHRKNAQQTRLAAKALGLCRACRKPAIPDQTMCEVCAEKHRQRRRKSDAARRARQKAQRESQRQASAV